MAFLNRYILEATPIKGKNGIGVVLPFASDKYADAIIFANRLRLKGGHRFRLIDTDTKQVIDETGRKVKDRPRMVGDARIIRITV